MDDGGSESSASIDMETRIAEATQKLQRLENQQARTGGGRDSSRPPPETVTLDAAPTPSSSTAAASGSSWHNPSGTLDTSNSSSRKMSF